MSIITFWSNNRKAIGQTVAASAAATIMAMEHNYKVLLLSADFNNHSIEDCFGAQESNKNIIKTLIRKPQVTIDSGIQGLLKLADSNRITPDVIHDYTKIIFKNRLEVLYSPMDIEQEKQEDIMEKFKTIILNASRYYDYVFVDLEKGSKHEAEAEILQASDIIVANVQQGMNSITSFLATDEMKAYADKMIWNLCRYDKKSKYNTKNIVRTILKRKAVYETHYNTLVFEACQEGNLVELLIRFKTIKDEDENALFISKIEELNNGILLKYQELRMKM